MELTPKNTVVEINGKTDFYIGLTLALSSSVFIGSSFIIKKISLQRLNKRGCLRAGAGGFGYLKDWMWWLGLLTMGVGELANFAAYAFAPAALVTPLGALSILVSAVLAIKCLNESLNIISACGCLLCLLGSIVIVIHAPKEEQVESLAELITKLENPAFINYVLIVCFIIIAIIFYVGPRYGSRHVTVYITLCSAAGSLTVMACKGLGLAIRDNFLHTATSPGVVQNWVTYGLFLVVIVCISVQMNYLNKALDLFSTSIVTPIYYVMFTSLVIIASAILFKEWFKMQPSDILGAICGFLIVVVAIFLLNMYRDVETYRQFQPLMIRSRDYGANTNYFRSSL